ncbi:hypothetical protein EOC94_22580 [Mesorhizobium sp. M6A.T.Ce.TU.016.01.1.1]|nr:hypothetical protein EOC94_22580 [Mesorhizobium sp. M6A.T.Ce.TU.016.01.1.1]
MTSRRLSPICNGARERGAPELPISPQVGEMAGRPEGGAVPPAYPRISPELQPLPEGRPPLPHPTTSRCLTTAKPIGPISAACRRA